MNLDCISQILIDAGAATNPGLDIFQLHMPEECIKGILLKMPISGVKINHYLPGFLRASFQVIVRAPTHDLGDPIAKIIMKCLKISNRDFPGADPKFLIKQMFPTALPIVYPRSAGNLYEWSINAECTYISDEV